mgnify:CR=1 FL=1
MASLTTTAANTDAPALAWAAGTAVVHHNKYENRNLEVTNVLYSMDVSTDTESTGNVVLAQGRGYIVQGGPVQIEQEFLDGPKPGGIGSLVPASLDARGNIVRIHPVEGIDVEEDDVKKSVTANWETLSLLYGEKPSVVERLTSRGVDALRVKVCKKTSSIELCKLAGKDYMLDVGGEVLAEMFPPTEIHLTATIELEGGRPHEIMQVKLTTLPSDDHRIKYETDPEVRKAAGLTHRLSATGVVCYRTEWHWSDGPAAANVPSEGLTADGKIGNALLVATENSDSHMNAISEFLKPFGIHSLYRDNAIFYDSDDESDGESYFAFGGSYSEYQEVRGSSQQDQRDAGAEEFLQMQ